MRNWITDSCNSSPNELLGRSSSLQGMWLEVRSTILVCCTISGNVMQLLTIYGAYTDYRLGRFPFIISWHVTLKLSGFQSISNVLLVWFFFFHHCPSGAVFIAPQTVVANRKIWMSGMTFRVERSARTACGEYVKGNTRFKSTPLSGCSNPTLKQPPGDIIHDLKNKRRHHDDAGSSGSDNPCWRWHLSPPCPLGMGGRVILETLLCLETGFNIKYKIRSSILWYLLSARAGGSWTSLLSNQTHWY